MGRTRLINANAESPLVEPLREILMVVTGPVVVLAEELRHINGIDTAFALRLVRRSVLGDVGPAPQEIDLIVLGEPDVDAGYEAWTASSRSPIASGSRSRHATIRAAVTELRGTDLPEWACLSRGAWWIGAAGRRHADSAHA